MPVKKGTKRKANARVAENNEVRNKRARRTEVLDRSSSISPDPVPTGTRSRPQTRQSRRDDPPSDRSRSPSPTRHRGQQHITTAQVHRHSPPPERIVRAPRRRLRTPTPDIQEIREDAITPSPTGSPSTRASTTLEPPQSRTSHVPSGPTKHSQTHSNDSTRASAHSEPHSVISTHTHTTNSDTTDNYISVKIASDLIDVCDGSNVITFIKQCRRAYDRVKPNDRVNILCLMKKKIVGLPRKLMRCKIDDANTLDEILTLLKSRFVKDIDMDSTTAQFDNLGQEKGESQDDFWGGACASY